MNNHCFIRNIFFTSNRKYESEIKKKLEIAGTEALLKKDFIHTRHLI